jgi:Tol biopolymer transport system component
MAQTRTAPTGLIGCTEFRTNLPGGRAVNVFTERACVMNADGTGRREVAPQLATKPNTWTQFAGWSPDGKKAIVLAGWESSENAAWEEEHKTFRMVPGAWLLDCCLVELATGKVVNLTEVERVSNYNAGLFFWPKDPSRLGFNPLIDGECRPFSMNLDGTKKRDLSRGAGFTYGFNASPDGKRIAYHKDYQIYLADADGGNPTKIETGNPFNFAPTWSPDGRRVLFVSGEHFNCHPFIVERDGTGLKKLADRGGYTGVTQFLDVPDYHGGSSDIPIWSRDSKWIYYTAKVGEAVELMRVSLEGKTEQLSHCSSGVTHYHPTPSPDGRWLLFGVTRDGVRQLYVARADGSESRQITSFTKGHAAMWASWQPQQQ